MLHLLWEYRCGRYGRWCSCVLLTVIRTALWLWHLGMLIDFKGFRLVLYVCVDATYECRIRVEDLIRWYWRYEALATEYIIVLTLVLLGCVHIDLSRLALVRCRIMFVFCLCCFDWCACYWAALVWLAFQWRFSFSVIYSSSVRIFSKFSFLFELELQKCFNLGKLFTHMNRSQLEISGFKVGQKKNNWTEKFFF